MGLVAYGEAMTVKLSPQRPTSGPAFMPAVVSDPDFQQNGILYGNDQGLHWAVVDVDRRALFVWQKTWKGKDCDTYQESAKQLLVVVFSNGPMMYPPDKGMSKAWQFAMRIGLVTIEGALAGGFAGAVAGELIAALVGFLIGGPAGSIFAVGGSLIGLALGAGAGYEWVLGDLFCNSEPYGHVIGNKQGIKDDRNTDPELYCLGRSGKSFETYRVEHSEPSGMVEAIGGLVPLVKNRAAMTSSANLPSGAPDPHYNRYYSMLASKSGMMAWALVPFVAPMQRSPQDGPLMADDWYMSLRATSKKGVLLAIGNPGANYNSTIAGILVGLGASDAVAMDGSSSVMMGAPGELFFPSHGLGPDKNRIQRYGFAAQ